MLFQTDRERTTGKSAPVIVGALILFLPGCSTSAAASVTDDYSRQDREIRFLEQYFSTKHYCNSRGLPIVVEFNQPDHCSNAVRRANGGFCPPRLGDRIVGCASR